MDFSLQVGDTEFRGNESRVPASTLEAGGYWWPSEPPKWPDGTPVPVKLIVHHGIPLGERERAPVSGSFNSFPAEHNRRDDFDVRIHFSESVNTYADAMRDHVLSVSEGSVSKVEAVDAEGRTWEVSISPHQRKSVAIAIETNLDCGLPRAICTSDGRRLHNRMELTVDVKEFHAPTGTPIIVGEAYEGQVLTVDTSGISDADGLTTATFSYQWVSTDNADVATEIAGATGLSYNVGAADEGLAFSVRVTFTDDDGNEESLTSELLRVSRPHGLTAVHNGGSVELTWERPAGWPVWTRYQVSRMRPELGETEPVVINLGPILGPESYVDTNVEPGVLYEYRVQSVDFIDYSPMSEPARERVPADADTSLRPVTGEFSGIPDTHDGNSTFTFELRFSEEFQVSYVTLRDHAFTVSGGGGDRREAAGTRRPDPQHALGNHHCARGAAGRGNNAASDHRL